MLQGRVQAPEGLSYRQSRRLWQKVMRATATWYVFQCNDMSCRCRKVYCSGFNGEAGKVEYDGILSMPRL